MGSYFRKMTGQSSETDRDRRAAKALRAVATVAAIAALCSCDSLIYDREGDCSASYRVRFRYDYNMKWADAFAHEVEWVTLYVADSDGKIVWQKTEEGSSLSSGDWAMDVDVKPGRYSLLAWAGSKDNSSFIISDSDTLTGLTCVMDCRRGPDGVARMDGEVDRLYHGWLPDREFGSGEGVHVFTVPLVKDTNGVRIVLQHISGGVIDADGFDFSIISDNGRMDWDNSLIGGDPVTYRAWHTGQGSADFDGGASLCAALAEFTVGRLVKGHEARLTIRESATGRTVLSVPLTDIALMVKGYYNRDMDDQEFLDRQDEYDIVFFLDSGGRWIDGEIYINSWKVVLQGTGL